MRNPVKTLALALGGMVFLLPPGQANLIIDPAFIKIQLTQNRASGTFMITNTGDDLKRYRAKAVHFIVTGEGGLKKIDPDESSLVGWIKFNPREFNLPPKTTKVIRYSIIPRGKLKARDHWCAIEFMPLEGAQFKSKDSEGKSFNISILSAILVPIYGRVNGTKYDGEIRQAAIRREKNAWFLDYSVANTGTGIITVEGAFQIKGPAGEVIEESALKKMTVFPDIDRKAKVKIKMPEGKGKYWVHLDIASTDPDIKLSIVKNFIYQQ